MIDPLLDRGISQTGGLKSLNSTIINCNIVWWSGNTPQISLLHAFVIKGLNINYIKLSPNKDHRREMIYLLSCMQKLYK